MAPPTRRRVAQKQAEEHDQSDSLEQRFNGDFFQYSSVSWYALILAGVTLFWMVSFHPDLIPYHLLGPIGNLLMFLKDNHTKTLINGQMKFTMKTTMMWTIQTLLIGFASLGVVLKYSKERNNFHAEKNKQS